MIWVITANTNMCHIYKYNKAPPELFLLKEINHPELRAKTGDSMTTEQPGHYRTKGPTYEAYTPSVDPKEVAVEQFSQEISKILDHSRSTNEYEKLIIVTLPHMNGLLFKHLNKHVKSLVINNIQKDVMQLENNDLLNFLKEHTKYPD
tara:strand:- start:11136 stop:11579 length:444 start_codon:yes stop_codon:yes gene_type:complete